ncbi:MAG: hypothetical protein KatS3mg002_0553 [Candidatus Woesearchaeota archaeon]|nr:MAG: hypothetical protein KatS3mg002_0553 [Candidatus Woesearchaeota archaeon]
MKRFFKRIAAGIIGADIFLIFAIMLFAFIRVLFLIIQKDVSISKYNLAVILFAFLILGFLYGIKSYDKRTVNSKLFKINKVNFWITILVALVFSLAINIILKEGLRIVLEINNLVLLILIMILLMYPFCAILSSYFILKKFKNKTKRIAMLLILNPLFIIIYFWLFMSVVYSSIYVPCGVSIIGVDNNRYTISTKNLELPLNEKIIKIDDKEIKSLNDVRSYLNNLESTKEIMIETDTRIFYLKTYSIGNRKYMGLLLKQEYCEKKY